MDMHNFNSSSWSSKSLPNFIGMNSVISSDSIVRQILEMPYHDHEMPISQNSCWSCDQISTQANNLPSTYGLGTNRYHKLSSKNIATFLFYIVGIPFSKEIHFLEGLKNRFQNLNKHIDLLVRNSQQQRYPLKSTSKQIYAWMMQLNPKQEWSTVAKWIKSSNKLVVLIIVKSI